MATNVAQLSGQRRVGSFTSVCEFFRHTPPKITTSRVFRGGGQLRAFGDVTIDKKADITIDASIDTRIYK